MMEVILMNFEFFFHFTNVYFALQFQIDEPPLAPQPPAELIVSLAQQILSQFSQQFADQSQDFAQQYVQQITQQISQQFTQQFR